MPLNKHSSFLKEAHEDRDEALPDSVETGEADLLDRNASGHLEWCSEPPTPPRMTPCPHRRQCQTSWTGGISMGKIS